MNCPENNVLTRAGLALFAAVLTVGAQAQAPLYVSPKPAGDLTACDFSPAGVISQIPFGPAKSIADANDKFDARAAAAICVAAQDNAGLAFAKGGSDNEMNFGISILAKMAYPFYMSGLDFRVQVEDALENEQPGRVGTTLFDDLPLLPKGFVTTHFHGEYEVLLQAYITLYYKYYGVLSTKAHQKLLTLLTMRGPYDSSQEKALDLTVLIPIPSPFPFPLLVPTNVSIPETENHLLGIEAARYLTNQLLYESGDGSGGTHQQRYDNYRNGDGDQNPPMVDVILKKLQSILKSDFNEYNARPYQNYSMPPLLNLASYAYDDRVKLAARMVLDYVSAKVAVSSNDLRRSTPFRRRNENTSDADYYGPVKADGSLDAPLVVNPHDPQTSFYAQLAGNTDALTTALDRSYELGMVHAGLRDYRVPPAILNLFINHGSFYQRFHHAAPTFGGSTGLFADELYAGSPSYLISAGGHPTYYSSVATIKAFGATVDSPGNDSDLGVAVPTTFMPSFAADWITRIHLSTLIQLGKYGTGAQTNMCVAPDFACGEFISVPAGYTDPAEYNTTAFSNVVDIEAPHWTFIDHSTDLNVFSIAGGYYLAIYKFADDPSHPSKGFIEAYDTGLHPGITFNDFVHGGHGLTGVLRKYGPNPSFAADASDKTIYAYETQTGQRIRFQISGSDSDILSTSAIPSIKDSKNRFADGTILNSDGSGLIVITNPALPESTIVLDMRDQSKDGDSLYGMHHPCRTEAGAVQCGGFNEEVWLDFNSPTNLTEAGDVYCPFRTLLKAMKGVASGGLIKIMPSANEPIIITAADSQTLSGKNVTIVAAASTVTLKR